MTREPRGWSRIEAEAQHAFSGDGRFPLPAYSEFMPAPWVGIKPYHPRRRDAAATAMATADDSLDITEYEQAQELVPGLAHVAGRVLDELQKLHAGAPHGLSRSFLDGNAAWPPELAEAAAQGRLADREISIALSLALSRTQDDKGNVRWTLFGASHDGAAAAFWRSFGVEDDDRFLRTLRFMSGDAVTTLAHVRVQADAIEVPRFARPLLLEESADLPADATTVVTFRPFPTLPPLLRKSYLEGRVRILPTPSSLVFHEHPRYRKLAESLPRATQIALLHLFPHVEGSSALRIPQSGWLDEVDAAQHREDGHRVVHRIARTHRWQRATRDKRDGGDGAFTDPISVVLFSSNPDDLGLYGKPMARNVQIWRPSYHLLLDGPRASAIEIERAARVLDQGGRYGFRFLFPPMRAGRRELYWHLPLLARLPTGATEPQVMLADGALGYVSAEPLPEDAHLEPIVLSPRLLRRPGHHEAATLFRQGQDHQHHEACNNLRRLLELREYLGERLDPALARSLLRAGHEVSLERWRSSLPALAAERAGGERAAAVVGEVIGTETPAGAPLTLAESATRAFEEQIWRTIAELSATNLPMRDNADPVVPNKGKAGGPAARAVSLRLGAHRDLERAGDCLHERHRALIARHDMEGRARVVDHTFRWQTELDMSWSDAWARNQLRQAYERNVVLMIPGRDRSQALVMADHYDTAYMEDVYDADRGGDGLRAAAAGADDNASATSALLAAADLLLPMAHAGKLHRDVWLVHLTGEEFPADCMGARALARALVEGNLRFAAEDGSIVDVSRVRAAGVFVLDMIAHNNPHDRDVFQIAAGEGASSARLARMAQLATRRWNQIAAERNATPDRQGLGRAERRDDGRHPPPPFAHLPVRGEIRTEWEPRSALYNTDGQIFSDVGVPVVLFMENYDISRAGYHDTHDTMKNIDLDYAAALTAIAIETVAIAACD
jgi:hypothetical protein